VRLTEDVVYACSICFLLLDADFLPDCIVLPQLAFATSARLVVMSSFISRTLALRVGYGGRLSPQLLCVFASAEFPRPAILCSRHVGATRSIHLIATSCCSQRFLSSQASDSNRLASAISPVSAPKLVGPHDPQGAQEDNATHEQV
jgi:hypothetical protein